MLSKLDNALLVCVEAVIPFPIIGWHIKADPTLHDTIRTEINRFWDYFSKGGKKFTVNKQSQKYIEDTWASFAAVILK
jgi:hypothetical protein